MESVSCRFKSLTETPNGVMVTYSTGNCIQQSAPISNDSIDALIKLASDAEFSAEHNSIRELRKLGCIVVGDGGRIPEKVELTGLGRQIVLWIKNR